VAENWKKGGTSGILVRLVREHGGIVVLDLTPNQMTSTTIVLWPFGNFIIILMIKITLVSHFSSESRQVFILPVNITSHA